MRNSDNVFIQAGNIFVDKRPFTATTVLGPCVSVCLWDVKLGHGGINHFMLPYWNGEGLATPKYGNIAVNKLIDKILATGAEKKNLVAKVFGGIESRLNTSIFNTGIQNSQLALDILEEEKITIAAVDVGGKRGRKVIFNTQTGKVRVKYINLTANYFQLKNTKQERLAGVQD
jgi:chemotaxis protein CheD